MTTPKFAIGDQVEFNEEPDTLAFLESWENVMGSNKDLKKTYTVYALEDSANDDEVNEWQVRVTQLDSEEKTLITEGFLRLVNTIH